MERNKFRDLPSFNNVKEILYNSVNLYPKNIAFTIKNKRKGNVEYKHITYTKLLEDINALGTSFHNMELRGKRIAIMGKNCYQWALAHLTCLLGDIVSVPLDKDLPFEELEKSLIRSKAECIVFDDKQAALIEEILNRNNTCLKHVICMNDIGKYQYIDKLVEEGQAEVNSGNYTFETTEIDSYGMSILLFTSGTTANSKAVMISQNAIAVNVYDMLIVEAFYPNDVNIAFLPYHHIFGSTAIIVMLSSGLKTVFPDGLKYIKQNMVEYKVTVFVGVPLLINKIYQAIEKELSKQNKTKLVEKAICVSNWLLKHKIDIRRKLFKKIIDQLGGELRFIVAGGAPLDKETSKRFNELGIHLVQGYGLTETAPVVSAENDYCIKSGSVGIPMRSLSVEIDSPDENGIGEIKVKGPSVMLGYYEDENATRAVLRDGWFYTGDLGYFDEEGYMFITGRNKDMIVMKNGKKVFPEEIETIFNRYEEIEDAFVFGLPGKREDVILATKIICNEKLIGVSEKAGELSSKEIEKRVWKIIDEINNILPPYKHIKKLIITKEPFIKTTTCKIKRHDEYARTVAGLVEV